MNALAPHITLCTKESTAVHALASQISVSTKESTAVNALTSQMPTCCSRGVVLPMVYTFSLYNFAPHPWREAWRSDGAGRTRAARHLGAALRSR